MKLMTEKGKYLLEEIKQNRTILFVVCLSKNIKIFFISNCVRLARRDDIDKNKYTKKIHFEKETTFFPSNGFTRYSITNNQGYEFHT